MRIVVLVKEVPDTYGDRKLDLETGLADRGASEAVLDEIGERALEVALSHADAHAGTEVVLLSMSPESAVTSLRKGLAMGAASAVQVVDERLAGADLGLTAEVLAAAVARAGFDLVITGNQSTDGSGGILPAMIAERLRVAQLTALVSVDLTDDAVRGQRRTESGIATVSASLPAVISITEALPDARFPNFKGIMAAKKKKVETLDLAALGVSPAEVGLAAAASVVASATPRPPKAKGTIVTDEGAGGVAIADFLSAQKFI